MALVNEYTFGEMTGTSLMDSIGGNTGTLGGATNPTWTKSLDNSKVRTQLDFSGGNGNTTGNRQRVTFDKTSFLYTSSNSFSYVILFKSSKSDTVRHKLLAIGDVNQVGAVYLTLDADEKLYAAVSTDNGVAKILTSTNTYCDGKWHLVVLTCTGTTAILYIDGILIGTLAGAGTLGGNFYNTNTEVVIGAGANGATYYRDLTGSIGYFANYNHTLTAAEVQRRTEEVLWQVYSRDAGATYRYLPPKNTVRDGLVAWYPLNGSSNDYSGNGYNGTDSNMDYSVVGTDGMAVADFRSASSGKVALGNRGNLKSISFWINLDSTTQKILEGSANDKELSVSTGTLAYPDWDNVFVNGVDTNTIVASAWQFVVLTSTTDVDCSALTIGLINATYGDFKMKDLKLWNKELSATEIDKLYRDTFIN